MNPSLVPSARDAEFTKHLREFGEGLLRGAQLFYEKFLREGHGTLTRSQFAWLMLLYSAGKGFGAAADSGMFPASPVLG